MRFCEYQGKELFKKAGIPVPRGAIAASPQKAREIANELGGRVMIKAQVPVGGRGIAGGIRPAGNAFEAAEVARELLGWSLRGYEVKQVLVEECLGVVQELYMGITIDYQCGKRVFMFSSAGGMQIEEVVSRYPEKLIKIELDPSERLHEFQVRTLLRRAGYRGQVLIKLSDIATKLFELFLGYDLLVCEINPLAILGDGNVVAADAKVELDDNSLFRHPDLAVMASVVGDPLEKEAKQIGVTYIRLDGEIGIVASGAGLGMYTMDLLLDEGLKPANFLETGGGITKELMANALRLVAKHEKVKAIIVNLYGGVNPLLEAARGVAEATQTMARNVPVVVKALGNQQEDAWRILEDAKVYLVKSPKTEEAIGVLKKLLR